MRTRSRRAFDAWLGTVSPEPEPFVEELSTTNEHSTPTIIPCEALPPLSIPNRSRSRASRRRNRAADDAPSEDTSRPPVRRGRSAAPAAVQSNQDLTEVLRTDIVIRNVTVVAIFVTIAVFFVNIALHVAIIAVGVLAPAWQTFKALEERPLRTRTTSSLSTGDRVVVEELADDIHASDETVRRGTQSSREDVGTHSRTCTEDEILNWQTYWIMAACFFAMEGLLFRPFLGRWLPAPIYSAGMFSAVGWLSGNRAGNARSLYTVAVRPAFLRSEDTIEMVLETVLHQIDVVSQQAVVQMNSFVAPYARQLEHAAAMTAKQLQEQDGGRNKPRRFGRR